MAVQAREHKRKEIRAVVHEDGSARVQTVGDLNRPFQKLIQTFEKKTGYPILLNTSFNVKGQPIVNTVRDSFECCLNTNLDALVVGDYLLVKDEK